MNRRHGPTFFTCLICMVLACYAIPSRSKAEDRKQISEHTFRRVVASFLDKYRPTRNGLISQRDVLPLLDALQAHGMIFKRKELLELIPADDSVLVKLMRSPNGQKFMAQTSGNRLMLDRLDRLAAEPGGERMLHDLMKLPDAARYAKVDPGPGLPDLIDFLPKGRSGKTRYVKDYEKPTGKLYTIEAVINYLAKQASPPRERSGVRR